MGSAGKDSAHGFSLVQTARQLKWKLHGKFHRLLIRLKGGKSRPALTDYSMQVPFSYDIGAKKNRKIAAVCHIFYVDLAAEMLGYLENLPETADIFISTSDLARAEEIKRIFSVWKKGRVDIRVAPNQGRDIAPKFITFRDVYSAGYEAILFIHSKKTTFATAGLGDKWRLTLLQTLAGSQKTVNSILEAFDLDPRLGMVIPQHFEPIREFIVWHDNLLKAMRLSKRMGFSLNRSYLLDFPSGSMFWARPEALRPLLEVNLTLPEFAEEKGQITGTVAHAIERLLLYICEHAGYRWLKIADPTLFEQCTTISTVASQANFKRFAENHTVSLFAGSQ